MGTVKVKFHGVIRDVTKVSIDEFDVPAEATVSDLLEHMHQRYGPDFAERVLDERIGLVTYVMLFLNNEEVDSNAIKTTRLFNGEANAEATLFVLPGSTGG